MPTLSTHVLDAALGRPAPGLAVTLTGPDGAEVATATTDDDGRFRFADPVGLGVHELRFATGAWFAAQDRDTFFPHVALAFEVTDAQPHFHVALLLSPFAYTTYRGS
ncbi:hydroxyisourate hydrolase [Nocardioides sp. GY 10127]|uniref:hydroxyisourate hydrolase n=1 Tax=Nocardioides sp. GY 10127 TaxID=2569762 RepID=UPI0010A78ADB|nr:hydroxyisourate hydrolase [Nocardioides sp. GY 10127]TIC81679.1 hydroxyisourate hydrolase [Nocardioides sp. GY 10127]